MPRSNLLPRCVLSRFACALVLHGIIAVSVLEGGESPPPEGGAKGPVAPVASAATTVAASSISAEAVPVAGKLDPSQVATASEVVIMPKVVVTDKPSPLPSAAEVREKGDMGAVLRKRYPGMTFRGQDPMGKKGPNYGLLMFQDDQRQNNQQELDTLAKALDSSGERESAESLRKDAKIALRRRPSPMDEAMDRSVNNDRR